MPNEQMAQVDLSLDVVDKNENQYLKSIRDLAYSLKMNPCARFYDAETGQAYVERILDFERGS